MNSVLGVSAVAVFTVLCVVLIKKSNGEIALILSICGVILVGMAAISKAETLLEWIKTINGESIIGETLSIVLRIVGISVVAGISMNLCKDSGESALAAGVGLMAKISVLLMTVPLLEQFLALIEEILML